MTNEHRASNSPKEDEDVHVGDLGSGSDFTPFLQHVGVPSTDIGSGGPYGVYHSTFDDYAWFTQNADPSFVYLQQMARVLGLEALRMADSDVLPYDYVTYARTIDSYIAAARRRAADAGMNSLDFTAAENSAGRFVAAAQKVHDLQIAGIRLCVRLRLPWSAMRGCRIAPGTNTPSTLQANSPGMRRW